MFKALGRVVTLLLVAGLYLGAIGELLSAPSIMQQIAAILVLGFLTLIMAVVGNTQVLKEVRNKLDELGRGDGKK